MNAQHLSIDELADAAEGLLEEDRAAFVELHLAGCAECRANSKASREVTAALRADVSPAMPDAVVHRLGEVVAAENAHRAVASTAGPRGPGGVLDKLLANASPASSPAQWTGSPAPLVYTELGDSTHVTVVMGCGVGTPSAGPSAVVPR
jgi:anti-sigma factor RsiW